MDTQRRHDLRENELAQQLQSLSEFTRDHGKTVILTLVGAVVLVGGWVFYANHREGSRKDAWLALTEAQTAAQKETLAVNRMNKLLAAADRSSDESVQQAALRIALEVGMSGRTQAADKGEVSVAQDLTQKVRTTADRLLAISGKHADSAAVARSALAILAEDRHDYAEAERIYREMIVDPHLRDTPIAAQAQYRLDNLKEWKQPVVFAPASAPASAPATQAAPAAAPATQPTAAAPPASAPQADPNRVTN